MTMTSARVPAIHRVLLTLALALGVLGPAHAVVFDFKFLSGGGNGAAGAGANICLDVSENRAAPAGGVYFMLWSQLPQPKSRIGKIVFDTGRHTGLFTSVSVVQKSLGITPQAVAPAPHAFLPTFTPDHWIEFVSAGLHPHGLKPGNYALVAATLAPGRTFSEVLQALSEGLNPATATTGLRVAVIVYFLVGGPPPGVVGTVSDDGGFSINAVSQRCQWR